MSRPDPHSTFDADQPKTTHFHLVLTPSFESRTLAGDISLHLDRAASGVLDLDGRDLEIESVEDGDGQALPFSVEASPDTFGDRIRIETNAQIVRLRYRTSPEATALMWLAPEQTQDGVAPFLFTQCQAIHARSILPVQDTPAVRSTFDAEIRTPAGTRAVMAAKPLGHQEVASNLHSHRFRMDCPIPSYLFAFAVGHLDERALSPTSTVYAEPSLVDAAADEFSDVPKMLLEAERLFGAYAWGRFDLLIMPPSFPYGGMENPCLTFLTPTLIAGDRSLANVVAHELAHAWTGNLVTNANMNHFWLNEGFTVYAERRILENLEGETAATLHARRGWDALVGDIDRLARVGTQYTQLVTDLRGIHPDTVYSSIPYEKGYLFLIAVEKAIGRDAFDAFLRGYMDRFRFQSIDTEDFRSFLHQAEPSVAERIDVDAWLHHPGPPPNAEPPRCPRLEALRACTAALSESPPKLDAVSALTPLEWQVVLSELPESMPAADLAAIDDRYHLSGIQNWEIRVEWLLRRLRSAPEKGEKMVAAALRDTGRMKYLRPLYQALLDCRPLPNVERIYDERKLRYHPVARSMVEGMIAASTNRGGQS